MYADAELHLPRSIGLASRYAEPLWVADVQGRITQHNVVEDIGELEHQRRADPAFFPDANVLRHRGIHVPERETAKTAGEVGSAVGVESEDAIAELVEHADRILEYLDADAALVVVAARADPERIDLGIFRDRLVEESVGGSAGVGGGQNRSVQRAAIGAVYFAEGLAASVQIGGIHWGAAMSREDGSNRPPAQQVTEDSSLILEVRIAPQQAEIVDELVVKGLRTVHGIDIPGIQNCIRTGRLRLIAGAQRAAPGKVRRGCEAVEIARGEGDVERVVVSDAVAGIEEHRRRLARPAVDGRTRHGAAERPTRGAIQLRPEIVHAGGGDQAAGSAHGRIGRQRRRAAAEALAERRSDAA